MANHLSNRASYAPGRLRDSTRRPTGGRHAAAAATSVAAAAADQSGNQLAWTIGVWFVLQVFFNDLGKLLSINVGVNLRPDRLLFPLVLTIFAIRRSRDRVTVRVHPSEWCMLLLFVWGVASLVIAGTIYNPYNRHLSTLINLVGMPLVTLWLVRRSNLSERHVTIVFRFLIGLGVYLAVTAVGEHFRLSALVFPKYILDPNVGIHWGRSRGPFGNAAVMGGVLAIVYAVTLFYVTNIRAALPLRALLALTAVAIYFTYTRSAWLTFLASLAVLGLFGGVMRRHCATIVLAIFVVFLSGGASKFSFEEGTLFTKRQGPVQDRENIMQASIAMIKDRPFLGYGYGTFLANDAAYFDQEGKGSKDEGNHNAFTGLLVELGLLGGVPYTLTWWFLLVPTWRLVRRPDGATAFWSQIGALTMSVLVGYLVGIQFFDPRFFGFMNCLTFFLAGLSCMADERYDRQPVPGRAT
jgi:O-antigen ligase